MIRLTVRLVARENPNEVLVERSKDVANLAIAKANVRGWVMTKIVGHGLEEGDAQTTVMTFSGPRHYFGREDIRSQIDLVFDSALARV